MARHLDLGILCALGSSGAVTRCMLLEGKGSKDHSLLQKQQ